MTIDLLEAFQPQGTIASITPTVAHMFGIDAPMISKERPLQLVSKLGESKLNGESIQRCLIFCPDALGCHIWKVCPEHLATITQQADTTVSLTSVMPPKTPVCFSSIFTGGQPIDHGIRKYERPVLKCDTLFDALLRENKKIAIVAVADSSVDLIFRDREMDFYSERYDDEVVNRAGEVLSEDRHDLVVVYQQEYDDLLHETDPFSERFIKAVNNHVRSFETVSTAAHQSWKNHHRMIVFAPDHGAHIDETGHGDHGLDIPEDMHLLHWYGVSRGD